MQAVNVAEMDREKVGVIRTLCGVITWNWVWFGDISGPLPNGDSEGLLFDVILIFRF